MTANENQIVVYQPNETVRLDVRLENETVWLTQEQIANLFGTKRPAITKHLSNIYKSGELEREGTCSILEHMGNDGKQSYRTMFYNLDAILSVGYRVNSRNATGHNRSGCNGARSYASCVRMPRVSCPSGACSGGHAGRVALPFGGGRGATALPVR